MFEKSLAFLRECDAFWEVKERDSTHLVVRRDRRPYPFPRWIHDAMGVFMFFPVSYPFLKRPNPTIECRESIELSAPHDGRTARITVRYEGNRAAAKRVIHHLLEHDPLYHQEAARFQPRFLDDRQSVFYCVAYLGLLIPVAIAILIGAIVIVSEGIAVFRGLA